MRGGAVPCVRDEGSPAALGSNPPKSLRPSPSLSSKDTHKLCAKFLTKKLKLNDIVISDEKMPSVVIYVHLHKGNKTHQQTPHSVAPLEGR